MATTQEFYRIGGRLPRYVTKLNTFANGMYLTKQIIPEGYAKIMANYDIDATGSHIKPRRGRKKVQDIDFASNELGPAHLTDYIYTLNNEENEVIENSDVVLSYGLFTNMPDFINYTSGYDANTYIASMLVNIDTGLYHFDEDAGTWITDSEGTKATVRHNDFWGLRYDKNTEQFIPLLNENVGYFGARTISNAYAFDKPFKGPVGRPIYTVVNNEIITLAGGKITFNSYPSTPDRNELVDFGVPSIAKLNLIKRENSYALKQAPVVYRKLNALQASGNMYNILDPNPYVFENEVAGALNYLGALAYENSEADIPKIVSRTGDTVELRMWYQRPTSLTSFKYKIEVLDRTLLSPEYKLVKDWTVFNVGDGSEPIKYSYLVESVPSTIRITYRVGDDTATEVAGFFNFINYENAYGDITLKTFDLNECQGMCNWQSCVGIYGVPGAEDTIFFSDTENPGYFPYPANVLIFDNKILAVHNYLDNLLVVTVDGIWLVAPGTSIMSSTQKKILTNVHIPEIDAINMVILKDEIFFKTDTTFYVLKPNKYTSDATDLKNYSNSTAIANYTKDFTAETVRLLNKVYVKIKQDLTKKLRKPMEFVDFDVYDTHSIIREDEVHYIYYIEPIMTDNYRLNHKIGLHLVYNTLSRTWRIYLVAVGEKDIVSPSPVLYRNKQSGAFYEFFPHKEEDGNASIAVSSQTYNIVTDDLEYKAWHLTGPYNNFPYLDTGNVSIDDTFTKRFREVQFNIANLEKTDLNYYTDFNLDGHERVHATHYDVQHITDENDPDYGNVYVTPTEYVNMNLPGETALGSIDADPATADDYWQLDLSKFPDLNVATVRFTLQGRGRRAAIQLLNTSLKRYELSDMTWVYRIMSAR